MLCHANWTGLFLLSTTDCCWCCSCSTQNCEFNHWMSSPWILIEFNKNCSAMVVFDSNSWMNVIKSLMAANSIFMTLTKTNLRAWCRLNWVNSVCLFFYCFAAQICLLMECECSISSSYQSNVAIFNQSQLNQYDWICEFHLEAQF